MNIKSLPKIGIFTSIAASLLFSSCLKINNNDQPNPPGPKPIDPPASVSLQNIVLEKVDAYGTSVVARSIYKYDIYPKLEWEYTSSINPDVLTAPGRKYTRVGEGWRTELLSQGGRVNGAEYNISTRRDDGGNRVSEIRFTLASDNIIPPNKLKDIKVTYDENSRVSSLTTENSTYTLTWNGDGDIMKIEVEVSRKGTTTLNFTYDKSAPDPGIFWAFLEAFSIPKDGALDMYRKLIGMPAQKRLPSGVNIKTTGKGVLDLDIFYAWFENNVISLQLLNKGYAEGNRSYAQLYYSAYNISDQNLEKLLNAR